MTRYYYQLAAAALVLLLVGCAHRGVSRQARGLDDRPVGARLSESQAIEIAKRAVERLGAKLNEYAVPTARYRPSDPKMFSLLVVEQPGGPPPGDHVWVIDFGWEVNSYYPGGDLSVYIDDKTGRAGFAPSM
jgi:hypothetical protein